MSAMSDTDTVHTDITDSDNQNFETINMDQVGLSDINQLLLYFGKKTYWANAEDVESNNILHRCINLLKLDYSVSVVNNNNGELCAQYPSQLLLLEYENVSNQNVNVGTSQAGQRTTDTIYEYESICDVHNIGDLIDRAKFARCRSRFPIPTILYRGKYVCRSSTLSGVPELYGRSGLNYIWYGSPDSSRQSSVEDVDNNSETVACSTQSDWQLLDKVRKQDIALLKKLNVGTIVDLMVENKKVKYGLNVTSSEKVDKEKRYAEFNIASLPYPGCEFFKEFTDNSLVAEGLVFDWSQEQCDAILSIPDDPFLSHLKIEWNNYKQWDLITMTQNYMKYLLKCLQDNSSGILIHCISGWDRTPLFISLIRLSLWADGLIHQSLDEYQIIYLTVAYDWLLFGHHLSDRLDKDEQILLFCFYMLKYLTNDEYSIAPGRHKMKKHTEKVVEDNVTRTDSDSQVDLLLEHDPRGSNASLNSTCSTVSSKSQEHTAWYHHSDESNGNATLDIRDTMALGASANSPQIRRTSPVTVPVGNRLRLSESSTTTTSSVHSSNGTGSWQVVTATGSLRSDSACSGDISLSHTSVCTVVDGEEWHCSCAPHDNSAVPSLCRTKRLSQLRSIFYGCYFKTVGRKPANYGQPAPLGTIISNLVEKVGMSQRS